MRHQGSASRLLEILTNHPVFGSIAINFCQDPEECKAALAQRLASGPPESAVKQECESKEEQEAFQQLEEGNTGFKESPPAPLKRGIVQQGSAFITDTFATSAVRHGIPSTVRDNT